MRFPDLLGLVGDEPVFESGLLLSGGVDPADVRRQLSRWVAGARLFQLRRGLYCLAPPFQRARPHPFLVANRLMVGSYVSLQSALAHRGLIPEHVPVTTSVTTGRPGRWETPLGVFQFHHIHRDLFTGYRREPVAPGQEAVVASAAKALVDLVHLVPGGDAPEYLRELRLAGLEEVELGALLGDPAVARRPKLRRAIARLEALAAAGAGA
jgi:predicted transcriptional regulator of viral defense system